LGGPILRNWPAQTSPLSLEKGPSMFEQFSNFRNSLPSLKSFRNMSPLARRELKQGLWFLSPWIFGFLAFVLIPILASLFFSFINLKITDGIMSAPKWVGFGNYKYLWNDNQAGVNPVSWLKGGTPGALWVTLAFGLIALPIGIFLPLVIALLMNNKYLKAPMFFRVCFICLTSFPSWRRFSCGAACSTRKRAGSIAF
jgi:multiple sugar transport system permease protein